MSVADADGLRVVAVTFDPHPMAVLRPDHAPMTLTDLGHALPTCSPRPVPTTSS